jgi:hypothetical protein
MSRKRDRARANARGMAQGLGWFSLALGMFEVTAPHRVTEALGLEGQERLVRGYGLREIAAGLGILAASDPRPYVWARVAGDGLDLGTLATALDRHNPRRGNAGLALLAVAGVTMLDVVTAQALRPRRRPSPQRMRDYSSRSGLPRPAAEMRGAARDFEVPRDFRIPAPLRPWAA